MAKIRMLFQAPFGAFVQTCFLLGRKSVLAGLTFSLLFIQIDDSNNAEYTIVRQQCNHFGARIIRHVDFLHFMANFCSPF